MFWFAAEGVPRPTWSGAAALWCTNDAGVWATIVVQVDGHKPEHVTPFGPYVAGSVVGALDHLAELGVAVPPDLAQPADPRGDHFPLGQPGFVRFDGRLALAFTWIREPAQVLYVHHPRSDDEVIVIVAPASVASIELTPWQGPGPRASNEWEL